MNPLSDSRELEGIELRERIPLSGYTWLKVGGPARWFAEPRNTSELERLLRWSGNNGIKQLILGRGTNLLIGDRGFDGLALHLAPKFGGRKKISYGKRSCRAAAGVMLQDLLDRLAEHGLGGLEDLYGIPGSLGGALAMNAGAYGTTIWPRVAWIRVMLPDGSSKKLMKNEVIYGYRRVDLPQGAVIVEAGLNLTPDDPERLRRRHGELAADRESKHPLDFPNCGSVFINPCRDPHLTGLKEDALRRALGSDLDCSTEEGRRKLTAGRLIEAAGLKGHIIGGAQVSEKHANFIINRGQATAADILALIRLIQNEVLARFGIALTTEVRPAGEF